MRFMNSSRYITPVLIGLIVMAGCSLGDSGGSRPDAPQKPQAPAGDSIRELVRGMTLQEKIGQMTLIGMQGTSVDGGIGSMIGSGKVGGVILYNDNIVSAKQTVELTNGLKRANAVGKLPLLLSADQEGGSVSRLPKEIAAFPASRTVGQTNDQDYARRIGEALGQAMLAVGLNTDFAPVLDVNTNASNPVIGPRAFGATADIVSRMGVQEMKGIRSQGVIAVVKHFPGHGDTSVDSHKGLPVVDHDLKRLRSVEFVPFAAAIKEGAQAVMVAHLLMNRLDPDHPASMSSIVIGDYLRGELRYDGVVITDDMTMEAITKTKEIGAVAVQAVQAGADIVLVAHDPAKQRRVLDALLQAVQSGAISQASVDASVYRIAVMKRDAKLSDNPVAVPDTAMLNRELELTMKR